MTDVVAWLGRVLRDEEREIRAEKHDNDPDTGGCGWIPTCDSAEDEADLCSCGLVYRRAWALARVEAERAILAEHEPRGPSMFRPSAECSRCVKLMSGYQEDWTPQPYPCRTVLLVASGWSHMPGYDENWKP